METRANHLWVGAITLLLLAALAAFIIWIARLNQGAYNEYDIFYQQSVSGLANGSQVSYAGVPVGQVRQIALSEDDPEFVRVRIRVRDTVPILVGTTATIQSSFTGVSTILLDGARKDAPPITCDSVPCPEGRPIIPGGSGGIDQIVANAPLLLERLATLAENLNLLLGPQNQEELTRILLNTDRLTAGLADATPALAANLEDFQVTLTQLNKTLAASEELMGSANTFVQEDAKALSAELRETLASAKAAADALEATLADARPATQQLSNSTLPAAEAMLNDMRKSSRALRALIEKLEAEGAGALLSGETLPDYKP